uniref:Uncharacterized protein n=1 Tax=Plectus sambesii TaxID=2011161 RepID=A0A914VJT1_9BILA
MKRPPLPPWSSLLALIISIAGCCAYCILFDGGVKIFSEQLNTIAPIGQIQLPFSLALLGVLLGVVAVTFLLVGCIATATVNRLRSKITSSGCCRWICLLVGNRITMTIVTAISYGVLVAWAILLCFTAIVMVLYILFYKAMEAFCSKIENRFFDLSVLASILIKFFTGTAKKENGEKHSGESLCKTPLYDYSETFIFSFVLCLIAMLGLIHFLMCMVANLTRLREESERSKIFSGVSDIRPGFANAIVMNSVKESGKTDRGKLQ